MRDKRASGHFMILSYLGGPQKIESKNLARRHSAPIVSWCRGAQILAASRGACLPEQQQCGDHVSGVRNLQTAGQTSPDRCSCHRPNPRSRSAEHMKPPLHAGHTCVTAQQWSPAALRLALCRHSAHIQMWPARLLFRGLSTAPVTSTAPRCVIWVRQPGCFNFKRSSAAAARGTAQHARRDSGQHG